MSNKRLSLDAFKTKAESTKTNDILESIQGGKEMGECHGWDGTVEKAVIAVLDEFLN
jgi:hypothetical protein